MSEQANLKTLRCPTCGAPLKAENNSDAIVCVYCGNTVVPVTEAAAPQQENVGISGAVKVEGIKTSSSALAYMELFFEEYDWDSFAYAQTLSVAEMDVLAESLKSASADDKNTWFACFRAVACPFRYKLQGCQRILESVIAEHKKDNLDAYSRFDAYKRIAGMVMGRKNTVLSHLENIVSKAQKYGASGEEVCKLREELEEIKAASLVLYKDVESIPQVKDHIAWKNARIVETLAARGINAQAEYAKAQTLMEQRNFVEALNILLTLKGYEDSDSLIEKLDKYFLISDVLEVEGKLYYFQKSAGEVDTLQLYPTEDGKIGAKPLIKNIGKIVTNHADLLYYLDGGYKLRRFNLATGAETKVLDAIMDKKAIYAYGRRVFLLARTSKTGAEVTVYNIVTLDLTTGVISTLVEGVTGITSLTDNKMIYTTAEKIVRENYETMHVTLTHIINVDTMDKVELGKKVVSIEGYVDNFVVYTQESPNAYNKNLYIKALDAQGSEKLVEKNIYRFCDIIGDQLFYYVGNSKNQSLITANSDGRQRKQWPRFISEILFEQGGWLYFVRKAGYNSVLCKSRLDGSRYSVIAADIDRFINIQNGYLYYINNDSTLVKVRMDGSNLQKLCEDVESVLSVQEDKIIFVSVDDRIVIGTFEQTTKLVKSIYAVEFSGGGKIKLAYDIQSAREYDENTVYYVAAREIKSSYDQLGKQVNVLYKLDVQTNRAGKLLELEKQHPVEEESKISGFVVAMIVMGMALFFALVGLAGEAFGFSALCIVIAIVAAAVGLLLRFGKKYIKGFIDDFIKDLKS